MNRNIDVLGPIVAVNVFSIVIREKERPSARLQDAVHFRRDPFQLGVVINGFDAEQRIKKFAVTWKFGSVGNRKNAFAGFRYSLNACAIMRSDKSTPTTIALDACWPNT